MIRNSEHNVPNVISVVALIIGLVLSPASFAQSTGNPNPQVLPPNAHAFGATYSEWSAAWWQWGLSIPEATNPFIRDDADCAQGQGGKVWFLAGAFGPGPNDRTCLVPPGKALLFSPLNALDGAVAFDCEPSIPDTPCDVETLRALAALVVDNPQALIVTLDGARLQDVATYRVRSPVFSITLPADNVLHALFPDVPIPAGTYMPHVSDGYFLLLSPLSAGAHTLHLQAVNNGGFAINITYHLMVGH